MAELLLLLLAFMAVSASAAHESFWFHNLTELPLLNKSARTSGLRNPLMVPLSLISSAAAKGAVCLDGTLPGYHFHPGYGSGYNSWLIQLEGGGWCNTIRSCVYRKTTRRGSSNYMEKRIPFTGILSNYAEDNPDFFNWNRVKVRYCDGASFTGDSSYQNPQLEFRGQRIWKAAMEELMSKGMLYAKQALLSGCSAGALASILHCDNFRGLFTPHTNVKCLADGGLFLDALDIAGQHTLRNMFSGVVSLQGIGSNLPGYCTSHLDPTSVTLFFSGISLKFSNDFLVELFLYLQCFFPENVIAGVETPLFLLNAAYDSWQVQASLATASSDPQGSWSQCKLNHSRCSSSQMEFLQSFRYEMIEALSGFSSSPHNGFFINSCFAHCQSERQDTWFAADSPLMGNRRIAVAVGDWYFGRARVHAVDCPYPCDKSCHNLVFKR